MERLCAAVVRTIETYGVELPSIDDDPSTTSRDIGSVRWVEYAASCSKEVAVVAELRQHVDTLTSNFGATFDIATDAGTDGRPLLYAACLGLLCSRRPPEPSSDDAIATETATPPSVFLAILSFLADELGASVNRRTLTPGACNRPPLQLVARACYPEAVRAMLDRGADPFSTDDEGWTALMACCVEPDEDMEGPSIEDRVETAKILLHNMAKAEHGAGGVDDTNYQGYTALHFVCEGLMAPMVKLLLDHGADPISRTIYGESPLGIVLWNERKNHASAELCREYLLAAMNNDEFSHNQYYVEEQKMIELIQFVDHVLIPAAEGEGSTNTEADIFVDEGDRRHHRLLVAIMNHVGMDPNLLLSQQQINKRPGTTNCNVVDWNWYEELHRRVHALIPDAFLKVYRDDEPTADEYNLITSHDGNAKNEAEFCPDEKSGARFIDVGVLRGSALMRHRQRGHVACNMDNFIKLILIPVQLNIAFAVPSNAVLERIAQHAPKVVEVGAGAGYWSAMLRQMNVDVVAYDSDPPTFDKKAGSKSTNSFFANRAFTNILQGNGSKIFCGEEGARLASERALLMVWPNNPDHIDNPHLLANDEDREMKLPVWDADCLADYIKGGGTIVIYVGEREERISLQSDATGPDCGFCSSRRFQQMLKEEFDLVGQLECPRWCFKEDDVTIWKRRR